jgi:hypothetical protein
LTRRLDLEHEHVENMWYELKTKLHNILININYRSERQSHIYYWQYFEHMLKQAHDENNNIICLGDMNKNFLGNLPHNVNDILGSNRDVLPDRASKCVGLFIILISPLMTRMSLTL